jgi:hypothetical protein
MVGVAKTRPGGVQIALVSFPQTKKAQSGLLGRKMGQGG